jgi:hypothetical protein
MADIKRSRFLFFYVGQFNSNFSTVLCVCSWLYNMNCCWRERESWGETHSRCCVTSRFTESGAPPFVRLGFFFCSCDDGGRGRRFERNKKNKKKKTQILNGVESTHTHIPKGICCFICVWLLLLLLKLNRSRWIGLTGVGAIVSIFLLWLVTRYIRQE